MGRNLAAALLLVACTQALPPPAPLPPPPPSPPLADDEAAPIRRIGPAVLHGLMIEGDLRVVPDAALAEALVAVAGRPLLTIVSVCLDAGGTPTAVVRSPSPLPAFDRAALAVVSRWRFRPYLDGGVATPVCSQAAFWYGRPVIRDRDGRDDEADEALPPAEVELPASVYVADALDRSQTQQPPAPGVAIARVCRHRGDRAAPRIAWLQSSGDARVDRELFERRASAPAEEPADGALLCAVWSAIARPGGGPPLDASYLPRAPREAFVARWQSGTKAIYPADAVKFAIHEHGSWSFTVRAQICVDATGRPAVVTLLGSSGYTGYDVDLINGIAAWRYRPFTIDGQPVPACGEIGFSYRQSG